MIRHCSNRVILNCLEVKVIELMEYDALKGIKLNKKIHNAMKYHDAPDFKKTLLDLHKEISKNIKESKH